MARKNTENTFKAWTAGKGYRAPGRNGSPISTLGGIVYSYGVEIARFSSASDKRAILNMEKYSVTTSTQQRGLYQLMVRHGIDAVCCESQETYNRHRSDF